MTLLPSFQEKKFRFAFSLRLFEARPDARMIRDLIRFGRFEAIF